MKTNKKLPLPAAKRKMQQTVGEDPLLKALGKLEEEAGISKGDPLEEADPEGGFSTEGTPLSDKAGKGGKVANKSTVGDAGDEIEKGDGDDEPEESESDESEDEESEEETADEESESEDEKPAPKAPVKKSFRERVEENPVIQKALEVSDFIESNTNELSAHLEDLEKSISGRLQKSETATRDFNMRLAKAMVAIGGEVREIRSMLKDLRQQPNAPTRRGVISKSEVAPRFADESHEGGEHERQLTPDYVQEWIVKAAMSGKITPVMVTQCEQMGYDPRVLPDHIQKALYSDLNK